MIKSALKWAVPGVVTVLGGTALTMAMTTANIAADIETRSIAALETGGFAWAELDSDLRDLVLSGTTSDPAQLQAAAATLVALPGVRSLNSLANLAPLASPYVLSAKIVDAKLILAGAVPDDATSAHLAARGNIDTSSLSQHSGMPPRRPWIAGVDFALDQLQRLDQGEATISNLAVSLNGRAKSERDYRDLQIVLRAGPPTGISLLDATIAPALVSPYQWTAEFDGKTIRLAGSVPDDQLAERLRTADLSGYPVATALKLASGEPSAFADKTLLLLDNLTRLEYGFASIVDGKTTLLGAPATVEVAQAVTNSMQPSGSIVVLEPPRIPDYWVSATRQSGGVVVFDGYAPDDATRQAFAATAGADTSYLKLGRGAPERYRSAVDFGIEALALMNEGRFALRSNVITLSGTARSGTDYDALITLIASGAPQGLILAQSEVVAPPVSPYVFTATKAEGGAITLTGLSPSADTAGQIAAAAGNAPIDNLTYASGAPADFSTAATTGLSLLQWLASGELAYDGTNWSITGTTRNGIDTGAINADFTTRNLAAAGWSLDVTTTPPVVATVAPAPAVEPAAPTVEPAPEPAAPEPAPPAVTPDPAPAVPPETPAAPPQTAPTTVTQPPAPASAEPITAVVTPACQSVVAEFSSRNAILFQSGAAIIAAESQPALDELAADLGACPNAAVNIEGHTDADGDDRLNLALSVARAEAVVNALIERNIAAGRLYAVGFGESSPIADNATAEGKRLNRRIVITLTADPA